MGEVPHPLLPTLPCPHSVSPRRVRLAAASSSWSSSSLGGGPVSRSSECLRTPVSAAGLPGAREPVDGAAAAGEGGAGERRVRKGEAVRDDGCSIADDVAGETGAGRSSGAERKVSCEQEK